MMLVRPGLPEGQAESSILTVSQATNSIKETLETSFSNLWIRGEVSNVRRPGSGHTYFTLKDAHSQLKAVLFRAAAAKAQVQPEDGMEVVVRGAISVYSPRGEYQIIVSILQPAGRGVLHEAFERLKSRLKEEGLFDEERKRKIPRLPGTVGVVTSRTGAAFQDILNVVTRRFQGIRIVLRPCMVQGHGASEDIAAGIREMDRWGGADVLIVGRGGGSLEDLWAFNEETVARAISACQTPIISAVGHEVDVTIADLIADLRAPTPSAAAELVTGEREDFLRRVKGVGRRLDRGIKEVLHHAKNRLEACKNAPSFSRPLLWMSPRLQTLDRLSDRMNHALTKSCMPARQRLHRVSATLSVMAPKMRWAKDRERFRALSSSLVRSMDRTLQNKIQSIQREKARLEAMNPLAVLERGFCVAYRLPQRQILSRANQAQQGDSLAILLSDGQWTCDVKSVILDSWLRADLQEASEGGSSCQWKKGCVHGQENQERA